MIKDDDDDYPPYALISDEFVEALRAGDRVAVAKALRGMKALEGADLALVADLFDHDPDLAPVFPKVIEFKNRKPGKPADVLKRDMEILRIQRTVNEEIEKWGSVEAGIQHAMKEHNKSRTTIYNAYRASSNKPESK